jgi:CBS-domain-containing membrane protein
MHLRDVMKKRVEIVGPDTLLREAARKMNVLGVSLLPVCEGSRVVGLLTLRDIAVRATAQGCNPQEARVHEVMSAPMIYGQEDQSPKEAIDLMERWSLYRLPVLDQQMYLVGIVSLDDLCGDSAHPMRRRSQAHRRRRIPKRSRPTQ